MTRHLVTLILACLCALPSVSRAAPPPCIPGLYGDVVPGVNPAQDTYYAEVPDGEAWVWYCRGSNGVVLPQYTVCTTNTCLSAISLANNVRATLKGPDPVAQIKLAWSQAMVLNICEIQTDQTTPIWRVCRAKNAAVALHNPAPAWKVKPNGVYLTRPLRALVNGVLGPQLKDADAKLRTAAVGALCDVSKPGLVSGSDRWLSASPTFNVGEVALCSTASP